MGLRSGEGLRPAGEGSGGSEHRGVLGGGWCLHLERACPSRLPLFQGSSVCQVTAIGVTVILLYTSRACYNLFILTFSQSKNVHSFDYDWYNVSDQADLKNQLGDAGYVVFGVVLFVWELLPTTLVVYFFRVRNPAKDLVSKPLSICRKYRLILLTNIPLELFLRFSIESRLHPVVI